MKDEEPQEQHREKSLPKLTVNFTPGRGYTSTFQHSDGRKTVKTSAPKKAAPKSKPKFEEYDSGGDLGWYLRTVAKELPDEKLSYILMDVCDWQEVLEAMIQDHGEDAKLSDFDLS